MSDTGFAQSYIYPPPPLTWSTFFVQCISQNGHHNCSAFLSECPKNLWRKLLKNRHNTTYPPQKTKSTIKIVFFSQKLHLTTYAASNDHILLGRVAPSIATTKITKPPTAITLCYAIVSTCSLQAGASSCWSTANRLSPSASRPP